MPIYISVKFSNQWKYRLLKPLKRTVSFLYTSIYIFLCNTQLEEFPVYKGWNWYLESKDNDTAQLYVQVFLTSKQSLTRTNQRHPCIYSTQHLIGSRQWLQCIVTFKKRAWDIALLLWRLATNHHRSDVKNGSRIFCRGTVRHKKIKNITEPNLT